MRRPSKRGAQRRPSTSSYGPIRTIDTRPLSILLVVLFAVATLFAKQQTHATMISLWDGKTFNPLIANSTETSIVEQDQVARLVITTDDQILWRGEPISGQQLITILNEIRISDRKNQVQLEPEANAKYELVAKIISILNSEGAPYLLAGMEAYCHFDLEPASALSHGRSTSLVIAHTVFVIEDIEGLPSHEVARREQSCEPRLAVQLPKPEL